MSLRTRRRKYGKRVEFDSVGLVDAVEMSGMGEEAAPRIDAEATADWMVLWKIYCL